MRAAKRLIILLVVAGLLKLYGLELLEKTHLSSLPIKNVSLPIKYVRIEGVFQYLSKDEIKALLKPLVVPGFFVTDMQVIHLAVAQLPWVDSVAVQRIWPDAIDIKIKERKPYSRWGQDSLITEQGVVFTPTNIEQFQTLPLIISPVSQQKKVVEIMKGIKTTLADQALAITEFTINDRWSWKIKLTTGLEIRLGREKQLKKLQRFLKTLALVGQEQVNAMAVVDLRYPNGYAVSWKPDTLEIDWQAIAHPEKQPTDAKKAIQSKTW